MSKQIDALAKSLLVDPVHVEVTPEATTVERIDQNILFVDQGNKDQLLIDLLGKKHLTCVIVFTRTKSRANKVVKKLVAAGIKAEAIHGNKSQNHRTRVLQEFKTKRLQVLVATDIAARGIDVEDISHVINYDLPNEPETYVHRIGRTGRAGADGTAYSFCAADERNFLRDIEKLIKVQVPVMEHSYHSETARNATGAAARPEKKVQRGRPGGSRQGSGGQGRAGSPRRRFRG